MRLRAFWTYKLSRCYLNLCVRSATTGDTLHLHVQPWCLDFWCPFRWRRRGYQYICTAMRGFSCKCAGITRKEGRWRIHLAPDNNVLRIRGFVAVRHVTMLPVNCSTLRQVSFDATLLKAWFTCLCRELEDSSMGYAREPYAEIYTVSPSVGLLPEYLRPDLLGSSSAERTRLR